MRTDILSVLIWIQTVRHPDSFQKDFFNKIDLEKPQQQQQNHEKLLNLKAKGYISIIIG